ncbi:xylose isomerase-like [Pectinophora gossypiella]|uniref:xylose isomerase-like n=1 Tax=Pectinophora gossypiella TaxID=13191 RepID=UPI00214E3C1A|nr:xylose isomerase-like [Pectinophora gossypiella]
MATYAQPGTKRQKVRERIDNVDYFQGIDKVEYNSTASHSDTASYRHYSAGERVHSRPMEDWMKISVSFTDFRNHGPEIFGRPQNRPWDDGTHTIDNQKRCLKALFDLMTKLGIKYWTAFDSDLVPYGDNWEEYKVQWDDMVEFVVELAQRSHVKLLWLAPDLHSHARYSSGAMTNHDASTFIHAASQIKKCMEVSQRLGAETFLLWPQREGYHAVFQTDVPREVKLFAKMMKIIADYKERLNYRCQLLIMPYYSRNLRDYNCNPWQWHDEDRIHSYMWDVTSCLYFLKNYNLDRYYKVCSIPGHQMYMANVYNMLGGVSITNDFDHCIGKKLTLMMKCIVDQGSPPPAGINLQLRARRDSDLRDMTALYVKYIDAVARGLRVACSIVSEQVFSKHLQQRYGTYYSGLGSRLVSGDVSMEECEEYYKKNQTVEVSCPKSEHLDVLFQRYLNACDHI